MPAFYRKILLYVVKRLLLCYSKLKGVEFMRNISKVDLTPQLEKIYGKSVVKKIKKKSEKIDKDPIYGFESLEKFLETFLAYNRGYLNYYSPKHKQVTRFILITIEKYYGNSSIDFSKPVENSNNFAWEIEHIIPQKSNDSRENREVDLNNIGNLTLLPSGINSDSDYSNKDFQTKKDYLKDNLSNEDKLTINDCFEKNTFSDNDIKNRKKELLDKFNYIFYENGKCECKENFSIKNFVKKLNLKEY